MELNPSQRAAVEHVDGPLLVLAGAGSGKTRVVTMRIARLLDRGIPARSILAMTFTNKAAAEMKERVARLVGETSARDLSVSTFHSFGMGVVRAEARSFGLAGGTFTIFDQGDSAGAVREILRTVSGARRYDIGAILGRISHAKNALLEDAGLLDREADDYDEITKIVWPRYRAALRSFHAFDFDDLVCEPVRLWRRRRDVLERWQEKFRYLLIDEYQDTNHAQLEMVRMLGEPHKNVMVVGDDDQSIYAWRGADVTNILDFEAHFGGAKIVKLEHNYRSTAPVLSVANAVLVCTAARRHEKVLRATRPQGDKVRSVVAPDPDAEAAFIADEIANLIDEGTGRDEIAILYRSNQQSEPIEGALRERKIPFCLFGGTQFYEKKEVKDLLAYLKVAVNPRDEIALRRVLNYPARQIGEAALERLETAAVSRGKPLYQMVEGAASLGGLSQQAVAGCQAFAAVIVAAKRALEAGKPAAEIARGIAEAVRLSDDIRAGSGSNPQAARRLGNVEAFVAMLRRHDESRARAGKKALAELLQFLSVKSEDEERDHGKLVTLTTMHGAKGLEWSCVFIAGLEEGLLPHARTLDARATDVGARGANDTEEERRLFYVSITRARDRLWLCRAEQRLLRGKMVVRVPSRFLSDVPAELIDQKSVGGPVPVAGTAERAAGLLATLAALSNGTAVARRLP
jgi:superfamily I DNA/RNA helicase